MVELTKATDVQANKNQQPPIKPPANNVQQPLQPPNNQTQTTQQSTPTQQPIIQPPQTNQQEPTQPKQVPKKKESFVDKVFKSKTVTSKPVKKKDYEPLFKIEFVKDIPALPEIKDITQIDVTYPVIKPYANIHIFWDKENSELVYKVEEPELNEKEKNAIKAQYLDVLKYARPEYLFLEFQKQYFDTLVKYENALNWFIISLISGFLNPEWINIRGSFIHKTFKEIAYNIVPYMTSLDTFSNLIRKGNVIILFKDVFSCDVFSIKHKLWSDLKKGYSSFPPCFIKFAEIYDELVNYVDKCIIIALGEIATLVLNRFFREDLWENKIVTYTMRNILGIAIEFPPTRNIRTSIILGTLLAQQLQSFL